jgi:hypothetical protein
MSQLNVTSIAGVDGGTATNAMSGVAKVWVRINNGGTLNDDYNVSSITDTSTGNAEVVLTGNMADANYAVSAVMWGHHCNIHTEAAGGWGQDTYGTTHTLADADSKASAHGDLA